MKTSKITTTISTLNIVLFLSISSVANSFTGNTGDDNIKSVSNQTESAYSKFGDVSSSIDPGNEFSHLRFDANKFNIESAEEELPLNSLDYLRFDATNFSEGISSELSELPVMNQFDYLRFEVADFNITSDLSEMPVNEFTYLRFDVNNFMSETSDSNAELPVKL
jgi:hypothetical protein